MRRTYKVRRGRRTLEREYSYIPLRYVLAIAVTVLEISLIIGAVLLICLRVPCFFLLAMLFVKKLSAPEWIYAIAIPFGIIFGFVAMVKFVISAMRGLEALEKQHEDKKKQ